MKLTILIISGIVLMVFSCRKSGIPENIPACISNEISSIQFGNYTWVGSVEEFIFQNKTVYAFQPDGRVIADGTTLIMDANCNTLCTVGGFGGSQVNMCNGDNFFQLSTFVRTIWRK